METLCCSVWNDHSWHLNSLLVNFSGFPTAAYVSQNKMNVIVTYWAVCMCARECVCVCLLIVSVDFSLFIFNDRLQCRIANCNPPCKTAERTHPHTAEKTRAKGFVSSASPERSHTQCFHGNDTFCGSIVCCACRNKWQNQRYLPMHPKLLRCVCLPTF